MPSSAPFTIEMTLGQSLGDTLSGIAQVQAAMEKLRDTAAAVRVPAPAAPAHAAAASPARQAAARTATGALGAFTGVLRGAASAAGSVLKGVLSFARGVASAVLAPVRLLARSFTLLKGVAVGALAAVASAWGTVRASMALLAPAAEFERYRMQLQVLLKSSEKARDRFAELREYARATPFNADEVVAAGSAMQAFGLWTQDGMRRLRLAGDAAAAFGLSIREVVTSLNYLASGRGGEAMESLSRMGITREKLSTFGVRFGRQGELLTQPKRALSAVFRHIEANYGGMTRRLAGTFGGALEQLRGAVKDALGEGFAGALRPATALVNRLSAAFSKFGAVLRSVNWEKVLAGPLATVSGAVGLLEGLADDGRRAASVEAAKAIGQGLLDTLGVAWDGLKGVLAASLSALGQLLTGAVRSVANLFSAMAENSTLADVLVNLGSAIYSSFKGGVALLKGVLFSFSPKFRDDLVMALESLFPKLLGTASLDRARMARIAIYNEALDKKNKLALASQGYAPGDTDENARRFLSLDKNAMKEYERRMGWDAPDPEAARQFAVFRREMGKAAANVSGAFAAVQAAASAEGVADPLKEGVKAAAATMARATAAMASGTASALDRGVGARLRAVALDEAVRKAAGKRDALAGFDRRWAPEADRYRRLGWDGRGRKLEGSDARVARHNYNEIMRARRRRSRAADEAQADADRIRATIPAPAAEPPAKAAANDARETAGNIARTARAAADTAAAMAGVRQGIDAMRQQLATIANSLNADLQLS